MQTIEQIKTGLVANLNDPRMHGICLFINDLVTRKRPEVTVPTYRVMNTTTSSLITNVDGFIAAIAANTLVQSYPYQGGKLSNDRVTGYTLRPSNLQVKFSIHSKEDELFADGQNYFADYDATYNVQFMMAYMNDGDTGVPVKISSVRLVRQF